MFKWEQRIVLACVWTLLISMVSANDAPPSVLEQPSVFIAKKYKGAFHQSEFGLRLKKNATITGSTGDTELGDLIKECAGDNFVHLFFDEFGNNLFSSLPQGVSTITYVVHIVYRCDKKGTGRTLYSVRQTHGDVEPQLRFETEGGKTGILSNPSWKTDEFEWREEYTVLRRSTSNINFIIVRTTSVSQVQIDTLGSYEIIMSPTYHGSFDIGLMTSRLENPQFELTEYPPDPSLKTVKRSDEGDRGMVVSTASFYTSPIVLARYTAQLLKKKLTINPAKLYSRTRLDDHEWYERIYPTIGVAISDNVFENLFFGFKFEFARGGSIFAGRHYGKVSVYDSRDFKFGTDTVTTEDFNLRSKSEWHTDWAFGVTLEVTILKSLFNNAL